MPIEGKVRFQSISDEEQNALLDQIADALDDPPQEVVDAYAALGRLPGAVGLDEHGRLVQVPPEGGPAVVIERGPKSPQSGGDLP